MAAVLQKQLDNSDYMEYVCGQLINWGRWFQAIRLPSLDYPIKANFVFAVSGDQEFNSDDAERVEKQMALLKMVFPEQWEALFFCYALEYSILEAAQAMRTSQGTYRLWKSRGLSFMARGLLEKTC